MSMFLKKKGESRNVFACLVWRIIWLVQLALWVFLIFFILHYWVVEVPSIRHYHASGLTQGFDALAGIAASSEPDWDDLGKVSGHAGGNRYTRLQGDSTFTVWYERDELPTWNAGLAKLCYDQTGKLLWVRRYVTDEDIRPDLADEAKTPEYIENKVSGELIPIVSAWSVRVAHPHPSARQRATGVDSAKPVARAEP
ncbi:MAG: hypothetical protein LBV76_04265 [Deltaproteobacteria bacterium]|jgi:hypothetical protein|nr:hypothetical protein [Deltaproteobacteria bacterium]